MECEHEPDRIGGEVGTLRSRSTRSLDFILGRWASKRVRSSIIAVVNKGLTGVWEASYSISDAVGELLVGFARAGLCVMDGDKGHEARFPSVASFGVGLLMYVESVIYAIVTLGPAVRYLGQGSPLAGNIVVFLKGEA